MTLSTKIPPESMSYFISITLNYTVFCTSPWPPILLVHPSFSFHLPSSFLLPNLLRCLQISPSTSVSPPFRLVEACLECTVSTDYFYSSSSPSSLPPLCIYLCACRCSSSKQVSGQWGKKSTKEARLLREYLQSRQLANTALPSLVISSLCIVGRCSRLLTLHIPANTLAGTSLRGFFLAKRHRTDRCKYTFSVHHNSIINIQNTKKHQKPVQSDDSPNTEDHCSECFPLQ